jgi:hypothetical protein
VAGPHRHHRWVNTTSWPRRCEELDRHIGLLGRLDERFRRIHGLRARRRAGHAARRRPAGQTLEQIRRLYADDASVPAEIERSWTGLWV